LASEKEKRILLVDGDESKAASFQTILRDEGYLVETATTGRQALEKAKGTKFHVAILNTELPDMRGAEVAGKLKGEHDSIRLIIQTDVSGLNGCLDTLDMGIEEILLKPIEANEILRVTKEALSR